MKRIVALLSIIILLLTSFNVIFPIIKVTANESIIYIDDDNTQGPWYGTADNPFLDIQEGINAVSENGTVLVLNGTYYQNIVINKTINLKGSGKGIKIIDGSGFDTVVNIFADNVTLQGFTIKNATYGIRINDSNISTILENTIRDTDYGIYLEKSFNNSIYHNNLINNTQNAYDTGNNTWDNGYPSGGNYWDDYTGDDSNEDSIGDTAYNITGGSNQDLYPFIEPINELPHTDFSYSPSNPTTQDTLQFIDESEDSDGYITSWLWDFGNGDTSTEQNPTYRYVDNGVYNVTLKVNDDFSMSANKSYQILILNVAPTAKFNYYPTNPTDIQNINFSDESTDLDGYISSWSWNLGDGNTSSSNSTDHKYADDGTYKITLTVTDDDGAEAATSKNIIVLNVAPKADFTNTPLKPTTDDMIQFSDRSNDLDGTIISWSWDLGDGTKSTEQSPYHNYSYGGSYAVSMTIVDDDGYSSSKIKIINIAEEAAPTEDYVGWIILFVVFLIIFIIMVGLVVYLSKKFG